MASITSVVKTSELILKSPLLSKIVVPLAKTYVKFSGYRQLGFKMNDLIIEETPNMQLALRRLPPTESYDRVYRLIRATQFSLSHKLATGNDITKPEEDDHYLIPYILDVEAEAFEKDALDNLEVVKRK
ncbi:cytochrome b-c1 complex subunit 7 [Yarrowia lipolytica]|uniref:Cytochrome b-c1 complex subunit 7 n=2 Tax=Yarrowia lipolytica TaxID=4952 RepID=QCR7_YARLI|nr:YALI0E34037p [Yarrowia lipolytica CLIB122]Q6C3K7.1 RecName: Full=Cytochrome b-c1 complex subunit 7; AltName: Full=Complex III subunit 7; AltName: Full=Complex III subunit VII; AltName: Full=Ubiquinol-cytochrome c reductase complex 14 kDa protein [Yarrowia lipolytica CLIB122]8AB6_G Chain G, Cytochrome b-c1 complex subunit 7 [Yarrowia lipolytica]8AB6_R Chain R, Cytochrome b-c1 complex subunit 7 [Yarrowia lipolytica]8AB7_G Chain G, Cytochrome b-c1 complex subunit 7 [Yarrowia lipolytica]8AB7_R |eukprot:XP_504755.1 YALI0E34037p [Yarrowia lipolytica CLIB122]